MSGPNGVPPGAPPQAGPPMWNGQPVLFMIVQSPQGTGWVSPMPPRQLLRLLVQMTEDVREQAQAQFVAETSDQRVQVVPALPRPV